MKIIILGASNEISPEGWTKSLAGFELIKGSAGASSSSSGVFNFIKLGNITADFAVLSFELNEDPILNKGLTSELRLYENYKWLILNCRSRNIEPVILILPKLNKNGFYKSYVRTLQYRIASDMKVAIIDPVDLFLKIGLSEPKRLMLDNVHMKQVVAQALGFYIKDCLNYLHGLPVVTLDSSLCTDYFVKWFSEEVSSDQVIFRKTSVAQSNLVRFSNDTNLSFPIENYSTLVSIVGNRLSPGGYLSINNVVKKFSFCQSIDDIKKYMSIVVDVKPGLQIMEGVVNMIINDSLSQTEYSHMQSDFLPGIDHAVELEGLLFSSIRKFNVVAGTRRIIEDINLCDVVSTDTLSARFHEILANSS